MGFPKSLNEVLEIIRNPYCDIINCCFEWGLLKGVKCNRCNSNMRMIQSFSCYDGYVYCCSNSYCNSHRSIRTNSLFFHSQLKIVELVEIFALWVADISIKDMNQITGISKATLIPHTSRFRSIAVRCFLSDLTKNKLGGPTGSVQVDESLFGHAKYHIGKRLHLPAYWCFGMIDNDTGRIGIFHVSNRSSDTLIPLVQIFVEPGTTVSSDQWRSYNPLSMIGYHHLIVNHSKNFVNPNTGAHTQRMESNWNCCKQWMRESHIKDREKYQSYIHEWCFRHNQNFDFSKIWEVLTIEVNSYI